MNFFSLILKVSIAKFAKTNHLLLMKGRAFIKIRCFNGIFMSLNGIFISLKNRRKLLDVLSNFNIHIGFCVTSRPTYTSGACRVNIKPMSDTRDKRIFSHLIFSRHEIKEATAICWSLISNCSCANKGKEK